MEKNKYFKERKSYKASARAVVKKHYLVLVFMTLVVIMFGQEFSYTRVAFGRIWGIISGEDTEVSADNPASMLSSGDVYTDIIEGNLESGREKPAWLFENLKNTASENKFLGRTNGVLAEVVNTIWSGTIFTKLAQAIRSVIHSDQGVALVFILGSFLWYALIFAFLRMVLSAVLRRLFLEGRVYDKVSFVEALYFAAVKKWIKASWTMTLKYIYQTFWMLTIAGGVIKYYSYFAVPYIVAENPDIGANQAISLSRRMMDGHKMELFRYQLSFAGWLVLSVVTLGISDMVYGLPYRLAGHAEFYARIREEAIARNLEGAEYLNDRYLFEKADKILLYETYFDVVDEITLIHEDEIELTGWRRKISDWFGIWIGDRGVKKKYDELEGRKYAIETLKLSMNGEAYPHWLSPLWKEAKLSRKGGFSYLRNYTVETLFLLFILFAFTGWVWEVALHFIQAGEFVNRGTLFGPWLPIYGTGGVVVLVLCSRFRKRPVLEFITSIILCGSIEYFSGWYLETKFHQRWWSYDGYFLNLHGRICAEGLLVFGIGCCVVVYLIAPMFDYLLSRVKRSVMMAVCLVLGVLFGADLIYSSSHPNMAAGAVEAQEVPETGEEPETQEEPETGEEPAAGEEPETREETGSGGESETPENPGASE